ncbi:MAG: 50S ribosomal protein L21e [Candidatus Bathyarchaeota archaeon]|nr:50S ribosomal protein L21e [Candidatus Bathyarchaeota archaeon]
MKKSKGYCAGTRRLMTKHFREKGKPKLTKYLEEHQVGANIIIKIDPSQQKSLPHKRFHGKIGKILEKRGRGYVVSVPQGDALRKVIVRCEHIEAYKGS